MGKNSNSYRETWGTKYRDVPTTKQDKEPVMADIYWKYVRFVIWWWKCDVIWLDRVDRNLWSPPIPWLPAQGNTLICSQTLTEIRYQRQSITYPIWGLSNLHQLLSFTQLLTWNRIRLQPVAPDLTPYVLISNTSSMRFLAVLLYALSTLVKTKVLCHIKKWMLFSPFG